MIKREDGFTLVELLVASTIMIVVLSATLALFEHFSVDAQSNNAQNDAQDTARIAIDRMARSMRNHAAAAPDQFVGIDKVTDYDLVFQTVDKPKPAGSANSRNVRRVRYCLDSSVSSNERIWEQSQTWTTAATPAVPSTASCPDPAWATKTVIANHIVNTYPATPRPVWTADSAQVSHVASIRTALYIDMDPLRRPDEQPLSTTIFLRNTNQAPDAQFTFLVNQNGSVVLNATGSSDPEGERITYTWYEGSTIIGQGLTSIWSDATQGSHTVTLTVTDQSGLSESSNQTVVIP